MAQNQVEEIKLKTDIVSVIGERIELKKAGRNYKALCPFHSEKTPSFTVSSELQIFKCFGCAESGDSIAFLEKYEGMEFSEALKYLADKAGIELKQIEGSEKFSQKEKLYEINNLASRFYNYILLSLPIGKVGLDYLTKERGLKLDTIKTFSLGFAPNKDSALGSFLTVKKKYAKNDVSEAGLIITTGGSFFDRFKGRVIFPIFDSRGNCVALAGRLLPQFDNKTSGKYINSPETPVYHKGSTLFGLNVTKGEIKREGFAIVVEGEVDLISLYQAGIKNVVAIKGSALTPEQIKLLSRITNNLILALDSDPAGEEAALRGIANAYDSGLTVKVVSFRKYKDPDEFVRSDPEGFKKAVEKAIPAWDFILNTIVGRSDPGSGEGKAKISHEALPVLALITDKIVQSHYVSYLARRINVSEEVVVEELNKYLGKKKDDTPKIFTNEKVVINDRQELLEERLLTLVFEDPDKYISNDVLEFFTGTFTRRVIEEYKKYTKSVKKFNLSAFIKSLPAEVSTHFSELFLKETGGETSIEKEIESLKKEIEMDKIKTGLTEVTQEIKALEKSEDQKKLIEAEKKFNILTLRLSKLRS